MRIELRPRVAWVLPVTMADLAFLLIIFLVLTLDTGLVEDVDLPEFRYAVRTAEQQSVSLSIARDGSVSVEGRPTALGELAEALRATPDGSVVVVYADREAAYASVDAVLVVLRAEERYRVVLAAERPP